jgi:dihydrofolate reductase
VDEPRRGGAGAWHLRYFDDRSQQWVAQNLTEAGGFLLGRRTYEILAAYWPNAPEEEQVVAQPLNMRPKYVASRTLTEPLAWQNSTVLPDPVAQAVAALKQEDGGDLLVIGSTQLVQTLIDHGLVDSFRVMIDPLVVGGGRRIFRDDGVLRPLRLLEHEVTTTGALLATYAPTEG